MQVGLVGVAGVGRDSGRSVTRDRAVGGMVEADQLHGALGLHAELRPEAGPQALTRSESPHTEAAEATGVAEPAETAATGRRTDAWGAPSGDRPWQDQLVYASSSESCAAGHPVLPVNVSRR